MKKVLLMIAFLLILIAIPVTVFLIKQSQDIRQRAVANTFMTIELDKDTFAVGETIDARVMINPNENIITAVKLRLKYDTEFLEGVSITNGTFLPNVLISEFSNGIATLNLVSDQEPATEPGLVATIRFTAKAVTPGPTLLEIIPGDPNSGGTYVYAHDEQNALNSATSGSITITGEGGGVNPTPEPSPSDIPGATPEPSPTTKITDPPNNGIVTTARPTIKGVATANSTMTLSISPTTPVYAQTFTTDTLGDWTHVVTQDLSNNTYTITVTSDDGSQPATSTMIVAVDDETGGTPVATPTPQPSPTATPGGGGTTVSATPVGSGVIPVSGTTTPTLMVIGVALLLIILGAATIFI